MEYKPFKGRTTVHNNERLRFRVSLIPAAGETPDFSTWQVAAPTLLSDGSMVLASVLVDVEAGTLLVDAPVGTERGKCQVDVLTDFGTGWSTYVRLGSVFAKVLEGSGSYA